MASIVKRGKKYSVIYYAKINGENKQQWETYNSYTEAKKRKSEVEHEQTENIFIPNQKKTVRELMEDFVNIYGEKNWSLSTYSANIGLIDNYVNPLIGDDQIQKVTPLSIDNYFKRLKKTEAVDTPYRKARSKYVGNSVIENCYKILRCAFGQAVKWEMIKRNPFELVDKPKIKYKKRDIWKAEDIRKALNECTNSRLYIAMNLSFACSLRLGEILGLQKSNVHVTDKDIEDDNAYVFIDKELQRASKDAIDKLDSKDIIFKFPTVNSNTKTQLVLKTPKTESSIRKVWLPRTVAYILQKYIKRQEELKDYLQEEYYDYDLLISLASGRPYEERLITKSFNKLKDKSGLPNVVFHSLRHSSTTYKLKINNGDLKATQSDTGHAEIDMITKVYAHILDEDRKVNAQRFDDEFYKLDNPDLRNVQVPDNNSFDLNGLIHTIQNSPELAETLKKLLTN